MSSTRSAPRTTSVNKPTAGNAHQTNGSVNSYEPNESATPMNFPSNSKTEFDTTLSRSSLTKNVSQYEGIYRNARFIHAISSGLLGQQVIVQTDDRERFHGVLETVSPGGDIVLTVSHQLDTNNSDVLVLAAAPMDLMDSIDSSAQSFELHKRIVKASKIVEIIAADIDLSGNGKCSLDENPKVTQFEDDRFSRMEHFYGSEDIDPNTLEELELGDDGKAGFDVEDMFQTNQQKFQTTTDYDESKYTNVPVPELSDGERAEIERKAMEIETGKRVEDVDEDDAGVKRPTEPQPNDGATQTKSNRPYRSDYNHDHDYNPSNNRRGNQRVGNNTANRRGGGGGNYSKQNQYTSTRTSDQSTYNRQQQYHPRGNRGARYTENRPSYEGRKSPTQSNNDEANRHQRVDSGNYSHGQVSGPTSPSTVVPARTIYPSNNRGSVNRNSPAPYTGSSSSCNNANPTTSPPSSNQSSNNSKTARKPSRNDQQQANEDSDQMRQPRSSNNAAANNHTNNRPSQLQSKQQANIPGNNVPGQEDSSNVHELHNTTQTDSNNAYAPSNTGATTPNSMKLNPFLNPEAVEFIPVCTRESNSRPESRGASTTSPMAMHSYMTHPHAQAAAMHLLQQQQAQSSQNASPGAGIIPQTHAPNQPAFYPQYFQPQFAGIGPFINATPQQISLGMMPGSMLPAQGLIANPANTPNTNNGSSSGMTTPNSSVSGGPTHKMNLNSSQSNDNGSMTASNMGTKKATVSVQRSEQANMSAQQQQQHQQQQQQQQQHQQHQQQQQQQQLQQAQGPSQILYQNPSLRYYTPDYMTQQGAGQSMQIQSVPIYYPMNTQGLIQAGTVGQPQNIMIPAATSSAGAANAAPSSLYYASVYGDPRMYSIYSTAPAGVTPHWQLARSPPHQQQQQQQPSQPGDQQRTYSGAQSVTSQQSSSSGVSNTNSNNSRTASGAGSNNAGVPTPSIAPQYAINGGIPAYAYGPTAAWLPGPQQMTSPQNSMSSQVNAAYNIIFDPSQQPIPSPQGAYVHPNAHESAAYYMQQAQSQQTSNQQNLDPTATQSNYSR